MQRAYPTPCNASPSLSGICCLDGYGIECTPDARSGLLVPLWRLYFDENHKRFYEFNQSESKTEWLVDGPDAEGMGAAEALYKSRRYPWAVHYSRRHRRFFDRNELSGETRWVDVTQSDRDPRLQSDAQMQNYYDALYPQVQASMDGPRPINRMPWAGLQAAQQNFPNTVPPALSNIAFAPSAHNVQLSWQDGRANFGPSKLVENGVDKNHYGEMGPTSETPGRNSAAPIAEDVAAYTATTLADDRVTSDDVNTSRLRKRKNHMKDFVTLDDIRKSRPKKDDSQKAAASKKRRAENGDTGSTRILEPSAAKGEARQEVIEILPDDRVVVPAVSRTIQRLRAEESMKSRDLQRALGPQRLVFKSMKNALVGTRTELFKEYLRQNNEAVCSEIRPVHVLQSAFSEIKRLLESGERDYSWAVKQLKSMRQDLMLQSIEDDFAVRVYEFHARCALTNGDIGEFNQCVTRLRECYDKTRSDDEPEFVAYHLLYCLYEGKSGVGRVYAGLSPGLRQHRAVAHAWTVCLAYLASDYSHFFELAAECTHLASQLVALVADHARVSAVRAMFAAYKPARRLALSAVADLFRFRGPARIERARAALHALGAQTDGDLLLLASDTVLSASLTRRITAMGGT
mmetsp:Transcript_728/g.1896  ORF Transcript_728/g.1896 Transcript_728/m.1896 type:complete len:630 (-) Transcript_728:143-2032(-)